MTPESFHTLIARLGERAGMPFPIRHAAVAVFPWLYRPQVSVQRTLPVSLGSPWTRFLELKRTGEFRRITVWMPAI